MSGRNKKVRRAYQTIYLGLPEVPIDIKIDNLTE
jgi:hypothetical protein